ncbi:zinc-binding protein A33-like [Cetorhinus maximus]
MASRKQLENLTKDVSCSICLEFFDEPVSLDCGHVFCRACILVFWESGNCSCPECRLLCPGKVLRPSRRVANIAASVRSLTVTLRDGENGQGPKGTRHNSGDATERLRPNTRQVQKRVKEFMRHFEVEFAELHQILNQEEEEVKKRLNQREQQILYRRGSGTRATTEMNPSFKQVMWNFLQEMKTILSGSSDEISQENEVPINMLIGEFGGPLQYIVWKQMRKSIKPALICWTLCPNSAHPSLILSEGMTRVRVGYMQQHLPDNPKRFQRRICVLGSQGFTSGRHYWEVEVDQGAKWTLGVVKESVHRKELKDLTIWNGYWVISPQTSNWLQWFLGFFAQGERASQQVTHLTLQVNPKKVGIYLDYEGGQVSFYNAENMSHLYTHSGAMKGKLLAFFSPGTASNNQLKLLQVSS